MARVSGDVAPAPGIARARLLFLHHGDSGGRVYRTYRDSLGVLGSFETWVRYDSELNCWVCGRAVRRWAWFCGALWQTCKLAESKYRNRNL